MLRIAGVHRQVDRARFQDAQRGDDQFGRLVQQHRDAILGADALLDEPVRQPIRLFIDFAIAVLAAFVDDRDGIG